MCVVDGARREREMTRGRGETRIYPLNFLYVTTFGDVTLLFSTLDHRPNDVDCGQHGRIRLSNGPGAQGVVGLGAQGVKGKGSGSGDRGGLRAPTMEG